MNDAAAIMEHGKTSLPEALNMGIGLLSIYKNSDAFKNTQRAVDREENYRVAVLNYLGALIKVAAGRR
ncbi:hypothetical protein [Psychrobacter aestuarii]|uniref:Uncharacterized protein n=1 Tax=Psychrobacter aestuarii TaxID=556327 RepID=A0ABP3FLJ4_9GAMM|nr:hypothetical protein [Psychrobacter aestuarii]